MTLYGYELLVSCLALNIYHESSVDPLECNIAIAHVTLKRAKDGDVCGAVFAPKQFSWANNARDAKGKLFPAYHPERKSKAWKRAKYVAPKAMSGELKSMFPNATHYHKLDMAKYPEWGYEVVGVCGKHVFYK